MADSWREAGSLGEEVAYEALLILIHSARTDIDDALNDTLKGKGLQLMQDELLGRKGFGNSGGRDSGC